MNEDILHKLFDIADQVRSMGQRRPDLIEVIKAARDADVPVSLDTLRAFANRHGDPSDGSVFLCPAIVADFAIEFLRGRAIESIFDPWAGSLLLLPLVDALHPASATGLVPSERQLVATRIVRPQVNVNWMAVYPIGHFPELRETFDVIVSCPPMGMAPETLTINVGDGEITIRDNAEALLILQACMRLKPDGIALIVVPNGFFHSRRANSVYATLPRFGLAVDAAITIPQGTFRPVTSMSATLAVIQHGSSERMFVGELGSDPKRNRTLLQNLKARKSGAEPALGILMPRTEYRGFAPIAAGVRVRELTRTRGIKAIHLGDLVVEINTTTAADFPGFEEKPNAVYIPVVGLGNVVSTLSRATQKHPSSYVQLVLDPDKAVAEYVAMYFNTAVGKETRQQITSGQWVPRLSKDMLRNIDVYLPDSDTQLATLDLNTNVENLISRLSELRERAWSQPRDLKQVARNLQSENNEDRFADWLDTLPFPLASILWGYHALGEDNKGKYERLLQLFEAVAEFTATILLSGFLTDRELFAKKKVELRAVASNASLRLASFGTWVGIVGNLAKEARSMLNGNDEDKARCFAMFRTTDQELLAMLFSSDIVATLQEANERRNTWVGHTGVVGQSEARHRLAALKSLLTGVRRLYGRKWEDYRLIRAGLSAFNAGVYKYQVHSIMGTRTPFKQAEMIVEEPMDYGELYFVGIADRRPLKLLPLIKVIPSTDAGIDGCYFYNRIDKKGSRFVSYHFEQEPERYDIPGTAAVLQVLTQLDEVSS